MLWKEDEDLTVPFVVPDDVVDLVFSIECRTIPVDHTYALATAIEQVLPWVAKEACCSLLLIHGADSGNGWERPENGEDLLYLSRRTKLTLRIPKERVAAAQTLSGKELIINKSTMKVGQATTRKLAVTTALYTRYLQTDENESEEIFIDKAVAELRAMGLEFKKILAGKTHTHRDTHNNLTLTRSLFIADLGRTGSIRLQERGIGSKQHLGFGVFIPHKTLS